MKPDPQGAATSYIMKSKAANKPNAAAGSEPTEKAAIPHKTILDSAERSSWRLKKILVPIDFSDCSLGALEYALALAKKIGAEIMLLHVVEPPVYGENYMKTTASLEDGNQDLLNQGRERLAELSQKTTAQGCHAEALVRMGRAQSEITDTAKAIGTDLIVIGTHGSSEPKLSLLGGTAERVVRHSLCPVLTVRHAGP